MSTHPTILGDMVKNQTAPDETTSLDVGRDLGIPDGSAGDRASRPARPRTATRPAPAKD